jgi:hypothetical protein
LGLLNDYSEAWLDTNPISSNGSDTVSIRTVPWISEEQISHLYGLGKRVRIDPETNEVIEFGSKVSAAIAIEYGLGSDPILEMSKYVSH